MTYNPNPVRDPRTLAKNSDLERADRKKWDITTVEFSGDVQKDLAKLNEGLNGQEPAEIIKFDGRNSYITHEMYVNIMDEEVRVSLVGEVFIHYVYLYPDGSANALLGSFSSYGGPKPIMHYAIRIRPTKQSN